MTLASPEFDAYLKELDGWEGRCPWMYLDVPGNVTVGVGHLVTEAGLAPSIGLTGGDPTADWQAVKSAQPGLAAKAYESLTACRLSDAAIEALKQSDLATAHTELLATIPDSARWPVPVQIACLDMSFNLGIGRFRKEYFGPGCHFGPACRRGDWTAAALQSARTGIQPSRNNYVAGLIRSAASISLLPAA